MLTRFLSARQVIREGTSIEKTTTSRLAYGAFSSLMIEEGLSPGVYNSPWVVGKPTCGGCGLLISITEAEAGGSLGPAWSTE